MRTESGTSANANSRGSEGKGGQGGLLGVERQRDNCVHS